MFVAVLLYLSFALFDVWFTAKRLPHIGIEAELNPFARWAALKFGIAEGIFTSVLIPTVGVILVCHNHLWLMTFMLGCRTTLFAFQLRQLFGSDERTARLS
jgi:hypothetical protein